MTATKWTAACCSLALLLGSSASARAANVLVRQLDDPGDTVKVESYDFETNKVPARAWVKLDVLTRPIVASDSGDTDGYSEVRVWVPGLSLIDDRIVFSSGAPGAAGVVCATVIHRRFLWIKYDEIVKTGRCTVTTARDVRRQDDGFVVTTIPVLDVYFRAQE
jgi:hypothetical protein